MADINPNRQTIRSCLNQRTYYIDFYQREYVWSKETVEVLLNDIFDAFEQSYCIHKESELSKQVLESFNWYYLNVMMTSKENDKCFIVDGQQRLSTIVLLYAKLYKTSINKNYKAILGNCIFGTDFFENEIYYLDNEKRKKAMDCIVKDIPISREYQSQTEKNLIDRFTDISDYIDNKQMDEHKLTAFIYFVLNKLVIVDLEIERQEDTPMIFEVINDRGESLKPFEILKGKMVGALSKDDSQSYSDKWDKSILNVREKEDDFFVALIKARYFVNPTRNTSKETRVNKEYHRFLFDENEEAQNLGFRRQDSGRIKNVKSFIDNDLSYYTNLYKTISNSENKHKKYCENIFNLNSHYQLSFAACEINDPLESEKTTLIFKELERLYMLLRLNNIYGSERFQGIVHTISYRLRNAKIENYRKIFDEVILNEIRELKGIDKTAPVSLLDYGNFKRLSYNTQKYFYYIFARVEDYLCSKCNVTPENDVVYMTTKHATNGYHIEHIFSNNESNIKLFESEEDFQERRNNVGGLILLKGKDNISSGNEEYKNKLATYSHAPMWGHSLCQDFYNSNVDFDKMNKALKSYKNVEFKSYDDAFTPSNMDERCKLLYEISKIIWDVDCIDIPEELKID